MDGPMLDKVMFDLMDTDKSVFPFSLPILSGLKEIVFPTPVTFLVGENGSGKSTVLETVAALAGFGPEGGSRNIQFSTSDTHYKDAARNLVAHTRPSWRRKPTDGNGYFFRAESFFNVANYIDYIAKEGGQGSGKAYSPYGGKSLHQQSHGESFLSFFNNRINGGGFFVFDEPEAALSPQRQLSLLSIIHDLNKNHDAQFIIASHSPILLAYPGATIYSCDDGTFQQIEYRDTKHYEITKNFLNNPDQYFKHLFSE